MRYFAHIVGVNLNWRDVVKRSLPTARLVRTLRGAASLEASGHYFPVTCEISEFATLHTHWQTGWVDGDLLRLAADEPLAIKLIFADGPLLLGSIESIDEMGATFDWLPSTTTRADALKRT